MKIILFILPFLFFQDTDVSTSKIETSVKKYCNERFGYCIDYPDFFIPQDEATNGDGREFDDPKGNVILKVYGKINQDDDGNAILLKQQYTKDITELLSNKNTISYQKLGSTFYVISGTKNGMIFYRKIIARKDIFCYAILEYKDSEKAIYDSVSTVIFKSFRL